MPQIPDSAAPWRLGERLPPHEMARLRRRMAIDGFKWDPRVGDQETLCDRALYLSKPTWRELSEVAQRLDEESLAAETEMSERPELIKRLSLPRAISRQLTRQDSAATGPRVSRYDFHWTASGWRVSEVNSDVPGGYVEASEFSRLFAETVGGTARPPGDPAGALADTLARYSTGCGPVALVHATAYSDDAQVMHFLAGVLRTRGLDVRLVGPEAIFSRSHRDPLIPHACGIIRFFPAEWLPSLGRRSGWRAYFDDVSTPQTNPASAIMTQSKRWGLVWDELEVDLSTWRLRCPKHAEVGSVFSPLAAGHVYKPTLGRVGGGIVMPPAYSSARDEETLAVDHKGNRRRLRRDRYLRLAGRRSRWVSQERFESNVPIGSTGCGPEVCVGVFVIDGSSCGVYARLATGPWVDMYAQDLAVLIEDGGTENSDAITSSSRAAEVPSR